MENITNVARFTEGEMAREDAAPESDVPEAEVAGDLIDDTEAAAPEISVPAMEPTADQEPVTLELDDHVIAWFLAQGGDFAANINQVLRDYIAAEEANPSDPETGERG